MVGIVRENPVFTKLLSKSRLHSLQVTVLPSQWTAAMHSTAVLAACESMAVARLPALPYLFLLLLPEHKKSSLTLNCTLLFDTQPAHHSHSLDDSASF